MYLIFQYIFQTFASNIYVLFEIEKIIYVLLRFIRRSYWNTLFIVLFFSSDIIGSL